MTKPASALPNIKNRGLEKARQVSASSTATFRQLSVATAETKGLPKLQFSAVPVVHGKVSEKKKGRPAKLKG